MKKVRIKFLYTDGSNWKTRFEVTTEIPIGLELFQGDEVTMGEYGTLTQDEFFGSDIHPEDFIDAEDGDHNLLEIEEPIEVLNLIKTNIGDYYFRGVMIDIDGTNLEEGTDLYEEDGEFIDSFVGLEINDEILEFDVIPQGYDKEDVFLQMQRVENAVQYGHY